METLPRGPSPGPAELRLQCVRAIRCEVLAPGEARTTVAEGGGLHRPPIRGGTSHAVGVDADHELAGGGLLDLDGPSADGRATVGIAREAPAPAAAGACRGRARLVVGSRLAGR